MDRRSIFSGRDPAGDPSLGRRLVLPGDALVIATFAFADLQTAFADRGAGAAGAPAAAPAFVSLTPVGRVTYTIPAGGARGQTAFVHRLSRPCDDGSGDHCRFDVARPGVLGNGEPVIREAAGGTFARWRRPRRRPWRQTDGADDDPAQQPPRAVAAAA